LKQGLIVGIINTLYFLLISRENIQLVEIYKYKGFRFLRMNNPDGASGEISSTWISMKQLCHRYIVGHAYTFFHFVDKQLCRLRNIFIKLMIIWNIFHSGMLIAIGL